MLFDLFVRRSREGAAGHREAGRAAVVEALIPVLDEIELARQHGDLTGTFATTAGKLETILADKFGLVRFGEVGEPFDPTLRHCQRRKSRTCLYPFVSQVACYSVRRRTGRLRLGEGD